MKRSQKNLTAKLRRARVTWRLDPVNYDFVDRERKRMGLSSMNAALNVLLWEHRVRCSQFGSRVQPL